MARYLYYIAEVIGIFLLLAVVLTTLPEGNLPVYKSDIASENFSFSHSLCFFGETCEGGAAEKFDDDIDSLLCYPVFCELNNYVRLPEIYK